MYQFRNIFGSKDKNIRQTATASKISKNERPATIHRSDIKL